MNANYCARLRKNSGRSFGPLELQEVYRRDPEAQRQALSNTIPMLKVPDEAITKKEVWDNLKTMDVLELAGPDEIHPAIVRPLIEILAKTITQLFNAPQEEGRLPAD